MNVHRKHILIGGGGHAYSLLTALPFSPDGYTALVPTQRLPIPYLGRDEEVLPGELNNADFLVAVGYVGKGDPEHSPRKIIIDQLQAAGASFFSCTSGDSFIAPSAEIAPGTAVLHKAVINAGAQLEAHVVVNTGAIVEHDVQLGQNVQIAPAAVILGGARIGKNSFVGAGSIIMQGVNICEDCVIGMGTVVRKNILTPGLYCGNPAQLLKNWRTS